MPNFGPTLSKWGAYGGGTLGAGAGLGLGASAGGAAGAETGGGALGALGRLLEPLDYPRQAAWNLVSKPFQYASTGDTADLEGALPGVAGVGGALLGALLGGPAGLAVGALAGLGGGQTAGKLSSRPERFDAPTGADAYRALGGDPEATGGGAASFLLQALGDPLTYAGGTLGALKGSEAGLARAPHLERLAAWRGPQYGEEGLASLRSGLEQGLTQGVSAPETLETLKRLPAPMLQALGQEIAPGSRFGGSGYESAVWFRPDEGVTSIRRFVPEFPNNDLAAQIPGPRPVGADYLPVARSVPVPPTAEGVPGYRVEHVQHSPNVAYDREHLPNETMEKYFNRMGDEFLQFRALRERLKAAGENPAGSPWMGGGDFHMGNVGWGPEGRMMVRDSGTTRPLPGMEGLPRPEQLTPTEGSTVDNILLKMLGGRDAVRQDIVAGTRPIPSPYVPYDPAPSLTTQATPELLGPWPKMPSNPPDVFGFDSASPQSGASPLLQELERLGLSSRSNSKRRMA